MALRVRIDPIEQVTAATLRADLSKPEQRLAAAEFARAGIEEAKAINQRILGRIPPYTTTVDGKRGAPLESVRPDGGQIITEFELIADVLRWIAQELAARSPELKGDYLRGHTVFADGVEIEVGGVIPAAEEYVFINYVPYARKIEIGRTQSGRAFLLQVPNRIYERTAADASRRFGNIAQVRFVYRGIVGGTVGGRGRTHNKPEYRFPAIVVRLRG
jgi:hypothetical protein